MTEYEFRSLKPGDLLLCAKRPVIVCRILNEDSPSMSAVLLFWPGSPGEILCSYSPHSHSCFQFLKPGPHLPDPPQRLYAIDRLPGQRNGHYATKEACEYLILIANYRHAIAFCAGL